jgi:signal transduction histidine kinase
MASDEELKIGNLVLTDEEVRRRKDFLELGEDDEQLLREAHPHVVEHSEEMVGRFYDYLLSHEHTRRILSSPGLLERLKKVQTQYFLELTSGRYDRAYFENRLKVGLAHQRSGLSPQWYLGAYDKYLQIANDVLRRSYERDQERFLRVSIALRKVVFLDMSLAIDAYTESTNEQLMKEATALEKSNQKLGELDAAKRRLTDMIVHDLQNPLAGIVAFLQILEGKPDGLSDSERQALREALARCNDLSQLILNVLQLSRAEEGKLELYMENVDLGQVARSATEAFSLVARQGDRRLVVNADDGRIIVRTDQSLLRRVLYNLIRNALRHTPEGTEVEVRVASGPPPSIAVHDNGPGIPPEVRARIFEPFAGAARGVGWGADSGLGLSFCKMAADALAMTLRLESGPGQGATFVLEPKRPEDQRGEETGVPTR